MKGDFSRQTFSPRKHYSAVLMQQGRVQLDADWNEQQAINQYRIETEAQSMIGPNGGPADSAGFEISVKDDTLTIGPGDYYVDGILCQNEEAVSFEDQDDLPGTKVTNILSPAGGVENNVGLVYLDVWERHLTALDDDHIREVALGGPDTTTRKRTVWQAKVLPIEADTTSDVPTLQGLVRNHLELTSKLAQSTNETEKYELRTELRRVDDRMLDKLLKMNRNGSFDEELKAANPPSTGKLQARTVPSTSGASRTSPAGAGYERPENQLYRVEIHTGGERDEATFKWSRDNGSVLTPVVRIPSDTGTDNSPGTEIAVRDLGSDQTLGFAPGQYVELVNDDTERKGQSGTLHEITDVDSVKATVTVKDKLQPISRDDARDFHYKLRRWDSAGALDAEPSEREGFVPLEEGIEVKFSAGDAGNPAFYNTGDYWLIPARTATGDIEWPENKSGEPTFQPAAGIDHHYSLLALVMVATVDNKKHLLVLSDCRLLFPPLTNLTSLFYLGGDGQEALAGQTLSQPLVVGVASGDRPVPGAQIKFEVQNGDDGRLTPDGNAGEKSVVVTTDARGEARCLWRLAKETPSQRVKASLVDGTHLPIYFNASLSAAGEGVAEGIQIDQVLLGTQELRIDSEVPATALADGEIRVVCNKAVDPKTIRGRSTCHLALEIPFPQTTADKQQWGDVQIGFQPLILLGEVQVTQEKVISCKPTAAASAWLKNVLFQKVSGTEILAHLTLKGNFVFPSGGSRRVDDFEMAFRLVKDPVRLNTVTLDPTAVTGQTAAVTGTVNIVGPAPAGGVTVALASSDPSVASLQQPTTTIGAGQTSGTFKVNTTAVREARTVTVTATFEQQQRSASLAVQPPKLASFVLSPSTLLGKATAQGTVTLTGPAPAGGIDVALTSGNPTIVKVPASVSVPAGTTTAQFSVTTEPVTSPTPVVVTASGQNFQQTTTLTVQPPALTQLALNPATVLGGATPQGTVTLNAPAPANFAVALRSADTSLATVPAEVVVPQNATSASFAVSAKPVASTGQVSIVASRAGVDRSAALTVQQPAPRGFVFAPQRIESGGISTGTITLNGPAPSGTSVSLTGSNTTTATFPATVTVPPGASEVTFTATGRMFTDTERSVTVTASYLGESLSSALAVEGAIVLSSVSVSPTTVTGRTATVQGTVTLTGPAPAGGLNIALSSGNSSVVKVPASVSVPARATTAQFSVTTEPVASPTPVVVTASGQNFQQTTTLTVQPPALTQLALNPATVLGGATPQGTVTLNGPAPASFVVNLSSTNTALATVQATITVPQNATSASFAVSAKPVASTGQVSIVASRAGVDRSAALTVQQPALSGFSFSPDQIGGGDTSTGTITLNGPAPSGTSIALTRSNTTTASVPASVSVPANATQVTFTATGIFFTTVTQRSVTVTASYLGGTRSSTLTVFGEPSEPKDESDFIASDALSAENLGSLRGTVTDEQDEQDTEPDTEGDTAPDRPFIQREELPQLGERAARKPLEKF